MKVFVLIEDVRECVLNHVLTAIANEAAILIKTFDKLRSETHAKGLFGNSLRGCWQERHRRLHYACI